MRDANFRIAKKMFLVFPYVFLVFGQLRVPFSAAVQGADRRSLPNCPATVSTLVLEDRRRKFGARLVCAKPRPMPRSKLCTLYIGRPYRRNKNVITRSEWPLQPVLCFQADRHAVR